MKNSKLFIILTGLMLTGQIAFSQAARRTNVQLAIQFDSAPQETSWELRLNDENGNLRRVISRGGPYATSNAGNTALIPVGQNLSPGLNYEFILKDSGSNGITQGAWALNTASSARTVSPSQLIGNRIANGPSQFGSMTTIAFTTADRTSDNGTLGSLTASQISPLTSGNVTNVTPTASAPTLGAITAVSTGRGRVNLSFTSSNASAGRLTITNLSRGRTVLNRNITIRSRQNTIPYSNRTRGIYLAQVRDTNTGAVQSRRFRL